MTEPGFWQRALSARPDPEPPEPALAADDVSLADWAGNRAALGIASRGDFLGVEGWSRSRAAFHVAHEETSLEEYARQREALGVHDAPQSSAANGLRNTSGEWAALQSNSPRPGRR